MQSIHLATLSACTVSSIYIINHSINPYIHTYIHHQRALSIIPISPVPHDDTSVHEFSLNAVISLTPRITFACKNVVKFSSDIFTNCKNWRNVIAVSHVRRPNPHLGSRQAWLNELKRVSKQWQHQPITWRILQLLCRYLHYRQISTGFHLNMHTSAICRDEQRITVTTLQQAPSVTFIRNYIVQLEYTLSREEFQLFPKMTQLYERKFRGWGLSAICI
jgi:hypothetical protein